MDIIKWSVKNDCPLDNNQICYFAAGGGHLDVIKWAREYGCQWDEINATYAAKNIHLNILKWCVAEGCVWNKEECLRQIESTHAEIMEWVADWHGFPLRNSIGAYQRYTE